MPFIAVHVGAGYHSATKREKYKKVCTDACEAAMKALKSGRNAVDSVAIAIAILENDVCTNAGYGSNLNMSGSVECDASVMDGEDLMFGCVGAISGVKNPIDAARRLLIKQREPMPLGLIAPNFLAGDGATRWALANGCEASNLISDKSIQVYEKNRRKLDEHNSNNAQSIEYRIPEIGAEIDVMKKEGSARKRSRLDTVGAICVDDHGRTASGVSSGGLILKQQGRVGQAAIIGAGCWSQSNVAITTTGIGEYIARTSLARECAQALLQQLHRHDDHNYEQDDDLSEFDSGCRLIEEQFFASPLMRNIPVDDRLVGVLALAYDRVANCAELTWTHSTASMCVGYQGSASNSAIAFISEMPQNLKPGSGVIAQSRPIKLKR